MSKYIRYTCNRKNEPVLKKDCKRCPEYNPCAKDGKWCFVGALVAEHDPVCAEASPPSAENAAALVMRDLSTITINLLREDIKRTLEREFYNSVGLLNGA